jgi:hypothetical protein
LGSGDVLDPQDGTKQRIRSARSSFFLGSHYNHKHANLLNRLHFLPTHATIIVMRIILLVVFMAALADAFAPLSIGARSSTSGGQTSSSSLAAAGSFDFDVAIVGCGVGGHGAALHARAQSLNTAVFAANDVGGTCVNRGCVPSKALLAASGRVRDMQNEEHLAALGITVDGAVKYDRAGIAAHAQNLADKVKMNLEGSLTGLGVQVIPGRGVLTGKPHEIKDESTGKIYTAKVTLHIIRTEKGVRSSSWIVRRRRHHV